MYFLFVLPLTLINLHCQREVPVFGSDRQVGHMCTSGSASPTTSSHTLTHTHTCTERLLQPTHNFPVLDTFSPV